MPATADKSNRRKVILLLVALVLAVVFVMQFSGISLGELPTAGLISAEGKRLRAARKRLAKVRQQTKQDDRRIEGLRSQASPFWKVSARQATQEVRQKFDHLTRNAQISKCRVFSPQETALPGYSYLRQVEFSVTLTATMKEVTRLMNEMERSEQVFYWSQCSVTTNRSSPKEVRLTGKVRALVLSAEAQTILAADGEDKG